MNYNPSTIATSSVDDVWMVIDEHRERIKERYCSDPHLVASFELTRARDGIWVNADYCVVPNDTPKEPPSAFRGATTTDTWLAHHSLLDPYYHRLRELFEYVSQIRVSFSSIGNFSEVIRLHHPHNEFLKDMPVRWTYAPWDGVWHTPLGQLDLGPETRFLLPSKSPGTVIPIGEGYEEHFGRLIRTNMAIIDSAAKTAGYNARKASIINFNCPDTDEWILDLCPEESFIHPNKEDSVVNQTIAKFMEHFETALHDLWRPLKMEIEDSQC